MEHDDRYQTWLRRSADAEVPEGFADRVMAAVHDLERQRRQRRALRGWLLALLWSRPGKVGIGTLAFLACVVRMVSVVALFFPE